MNSIFFILFTLGFLGRIALGDDASPCIKVHTGGIPLEYVEVNSPDLKSKVFTDKLGCAYFSSQPKELEINLKGYYPMNVKGAAIALDSTFEIYPNPEFPDLVKIDGTLSPFVGLKDYDGLIDGGVAITSFHLKDLFNFSPNQFVSQYTEVIDIFGKRDVPSNIYIPKQNERYIVNIKLEKEHYALLVPKSPTQNLASIHAKIPLKAAIDLAQKKITYVQFVNQIIFAKSGIKQNVISTDDIHAQDISFNLDANQKVSVTNNAPANFTPVNISLAKIGADFVPVDLNMKSGTSQLKVTANSLVASGGFVMNAQNEPEQGKLAILPNVYNKKFGVVKQGEDLLVGHDHQYVIAQFFKNNTRTNPKYNFKETNPQVVAQIISEGSEAGKLKIPAVTYDYAIVVGFDLKGTTTMSDISKLDELLTTLSFQVVKP